MDQASSLPRILAYNLLEKMTKGFSEDQELGRGSYGKVYLGLREDGEKIAVKMLRPMLGLDDEQFEKEYHNLERLQHHNIVRLVGYCNETRREFVPIEGKQVLCEVTHRALCFEYMQNGSLDNCISDESSGLDWHTRYAIIKGICKGLQYLHEELKPPMFHLDLKPANILLDQNRVAKIGDFGLSRLMGEEGTIFSTSSIGTIGYLPPEYINRNVISNKFDIFSFGVIIIKIMAGPTGYSRSAEMSSQKFIDLIHENWRNRLQAASLTALESYCEQIKRCITIALRCVEVDRHKRPRIGDILSELNETETMSQFPIVLRNDSKLSKDQESRQIHLAEIEETQNKIENLFGEVVDNHKLDRMARYRGKPKRQDDRVREACMLVNEDGKKDKALEYVDGLRTLHGIAPATLCLLYNATGDTLYHVAYHDWCGSIGRAPYPELIGNGQWAVFHHVNQPGKLSDSAASVVYRGKGEDGDELDYLLAWSTPWAFWSSNKAYCEVGCVDYFKDRWDIIHSKLVNSQYRCDIKSDKFCIESDIFPGNNPKFTASIISVPVDGHRHDFSFRLRKFN